MLRRLAFGFMAPLMSLLPLPLQAEVGSPSESKMIEFHQKWMNSLEQFSADPDLVEAMENHTDRIAGKLWLQVD